LSFQKQKEFLWELDETYASEMLHHMFIDDILSFLTKLNESDGDVDFILDNMEPGKVKEIEAMLAYEKETAGAVMTKELVSINPSYTVEEVLRILRRIAPGAEMVYYLFVIDDEGKLTGVVSLRDLIIAEPSERIANIRSEEHTSE